MTLFSIRNYLNYTFPRLTLHACALTHTFSLSYRCISLSYRAISISYALFHFPRAISIEQRFFPYIFEWAIYLPYYCNWDYFARCILKTKHLLEFSPPEKVPPSPERSEFLIIIYSYKSIHQSINIVIRIIVIIIGERA